MIREMGGDFHWQLWPDDDYLPWPAGSKFFASGRAVLLALWEDHWCDRAVWLPDYFCAGVVQTLEARGMRVSLYRDDPSRQEPNFETLTAAAGDLVVAVNYFGVRGPEAWRRWKAAHPEQLLVADHSHDPACGWALDPCADYAFASLRKTLPVSDGAVLWSSAGLALPSADLQPDLTAAGLQLAAMVHKADYLRAPDAGLKHHFRRLMHEAGVRIGSGEVKGISPWSARLLERGFPLAWRRRRERNVRRFLASATGLSGPETLFDSWPESGAPLCAVLSFPGQLERERSRSVLVRGGIYTPVHWEVPRAASAEAKSLSRRLLSVPLDHRYDDGDVDRAAGRALGFMASSPLECAVEGRSHGAEPIDGPRQRGD